MLTVNEDKAVRRNVSRTSSGYTKVLANEWEEVAADCIPYGVSASVLPPATMSKVESKKSSSKVIAKRAQREADVCSGTNTNASSATPAAAPVALGSICFTPEESYETLKSPLRFVISTTSPPSFSSSLLHVMFSVEAQNFMFVLTQMPLSETHSGVRPYTHWYAVCFS